MEPVGTSAGAMRTQLATSAANNPDGWLLPRRHALTAAASSLLLTATIMPAAPALAAAQPQQTSAQKVSWGPLRGLSDGEIEALFESGAVA